MLHVPAMSFSHFATKLWMLCKLAKSNLRGETYMSQIRFISPRVGTNQTMTNKHPQTQKKTIERIHQTRKERQNCTYLSKSFFLSAFYFLVKIKSLESNSKRVSCILGFIVVKVRNQNQLLPFHLPPKKQKKTFSKLCFWYGSPKITMKIKDWWCMGLH